MFHVGPDGRSVKYAIISDIHANLQAWQAVWADTVALGADAVICLGDIVGYGPRPAETLAAVYSKIDHFVIGNHDAAVADLFDVSTFNDDAQEMIAWTKGKLGQKAVEFFRGLPYAVKLDCGDFKALCVHGSMHEQEEFNYILDEEDARATWDVCEQPLIFVGHTHRPRVDVLNEDGTYQLLPAKSFRVEEGKRYIVNVGSVGMPRVSDFRACYCTYDTETKTVSWQLTSYDIESFKDDVRDLASHSRQAASLLAVFERTQSGPLREEVDFASDGELDFIVPSAKKKIIKIRKGVSQARTLTNGAPATRRSGTVDQASSINRNAKRSAAVFAVIAALLLAGFAGWMKFNSRRTVAPAVSQVATENLTKPVKQQDASPDEPAKASAPDPEVAKKARLADLEKRYANAVKYSKDHPDAHLAVREQFSELSRAARGTEYESKAKEKVKALDAAYDQGIKTVIAELKAESDKLLADGKAEEARAVVLRYSDRFAKETETKRRELAAALEKEAKERDAARKKQIADQQTMVEAVYDEAAALLLSRKFDESQQKLADAERDGALSEMKSRLSETRRLLEKVERAKESIIKSFRDDIGKTLTVHLKSGATKVQISDVSSGTVQAERSLKRSTSVSASVGVSFGLNDLSAAERARRLGNGKAPELDIMRGLLAREAGNAAKAKEYFNQSGTELGKTLSEHVVVPVAVPVVGGNANRKLKIAFTGYRGKSVLKNFPVLVMLSNGVGGSKFTYAGFLSPVGHDLRFWSSDGKTELNYEIEDWNQGGVSYIWVQLASLGSNNDYIWATWGNRNHSTQPSYATNGAVWSERYVGVYHLHEKGTATRQNSCPGGNHGTPQDFDKNEAANGKVAGGDRFDGAKNGVRIGSTPAFRLTDQITLSAWVKADAWDGDNVIIRKHSDYRLYNREGDMSLKLPGVGAEVVKAPINEFKTGRWYHIVGTYDRRGDKNNLVLYVNGVSRDARTETAAIHTSNDDIFIGQKSNRSQTFNGIIDEARISNVARSADWVQASYMTVSENDRFITYKTQR
jgi:predicted phosphodiesterase